MYINTKALYSLLNYRLHLVGSLNIIFFKSAEDVLAYSPNGHYL